MYRYDLLYVYDGANKTDSLELDRLHGNLTTVSSRFPITSTGPDMYLRFTTDGSKNKDGFVIQFQAG